ncbi:MAG: hypothetical protein LBO65_02630 [Spirochaetaceae bacterium]|jgi:4-diphosphocytidyl-2-C-methyl-D-erythritol kinase|nr:hypothetical protein [Spirochaetaceae bacterium]
MIQLLSQKKVRIKSPGKINLHLAIGGKRPDGFHDLESIFAALDFSDTLIFSSLGGNNGKISLRMKAAGPFLELSRRYGQVFEDISPEKNLVYRAMELFHRKTGYSGDTSVSIIKRIPPGSGMGGGSSNAASALIAMNTLGAAAGAAGTFGTAKVSVAPGGLLSQGELRDLGAELGSDIPFFVETGFAGAASGGVPAAWVSGRGERIRVLSPPPPLGILLAFPGFGSHTGAAYGLLDRFRKDPPPPVFPQDFLLNGKWPLPETWDFSNDFLGLFLDHGTDRERASYRSILEDFKRTGAVFSGLSGSGSACFAVFKTPKDAAAAKNRLRKAPYALQETFFLASVIKQGVQ